MGGDTRSDQLNAEILESVRELTGRIIGQGEKLAQRLGVPPFFIKALHMLDCPMAMKDLSKRMGCDASFVTVIADTLEKRGLARREAHQGDRRITNLILTGDGLALRERLEQEFASRMPWTRALDDEERVQLLRLIRKMLSADPSEAASTAAVPSTAAIPEPSDDASLTPPASIGEVLDRLGASPAAS